MLDIIIVLIILGIMYAVFQKLADFVGGSKTLIVIIVILLIAYLAFSWKGVFSVIGAAIGVVLLIALLGTAGSFISKTVETHDKEMKETAEIKQKTQISKEMHDNDTALRNELDMNCRWLGVMSEQMWMAKLPNYVNKKYSTSFNNITKNFATQMEQQNITQNDEWFQPFLMYVIANPQGTTVTKMLNEVSCPQFYATHITPNGDILNTRMIRGTKRVNKDVPPLFEERFIKEMNESLFVPTRYALKLYSTDSSSSETISHTEEIDFNDL
ncbi:hypothetical protein [Clostridium fungisolvens]|uniref:Uncharacterized protein n=1 Tax=Clostridium fungisolvens TaxID=1604897 RepID=A0A6V8SP54_9CLOT|nr:hypothetical protein [Clostridium fungisolvens]GFP76643.1 hypothetical protein bsdtw1_02746 [Clostridium fungisolvens]